MKLKLAPFFPRTQSQKTLLEAYDNHDLLIVYGAAGSGKTFVATHLALKSYQETDVSSLVLVRPPVSTGPSLGAFPGISDEKLANWVAPMVEHLRGHAGKGAIDGMIRNGVVKLQPLETIRGSSFENAIVIVDEGQNLTWDQIKAVTTRLGENSKLLLLGDPSQSDLKDQTNPLERLADLCTRFRIDAGVVHFPDSDIVRSPIVAQLVKAFKFDRSQNEHS